MTSAGWRPMGQTAEEAEALHEGVPPWMARSVWNWIETRVERSVAGSIYYQTHVIDAFDRKMRTYTPSSDAFAWRGTQALRDTWDDDTVISFLDFLLALGDSETSADGKGYVLERVLLDAGSAWKVGTRDDYPGLDVLTQQVVDVARDLRVEWELSRNPARTNGGLSCPTLTPG